MIDFQKLLNEPPEVRAERRRKIEAEFAAKEARTKMMVDKLYDQVARGCINNDWAEEFICSVRAKLAAGLCLTDKQEKKLEELFEQY